MGHLRDSPVPTTPSARLWSSLGTIIPIWVCIPLKTKDTIHDALRIQDKIMNVESYFQMGYGVAGDLDMVDNELIPSQTMQLDFQPMSTGSETEGISHIFPTISVWNTESHKFLILQIRGLHKKPLIVLRWLITQLTRPFLFKRSYVSQKNQIKCIFHYLFLFILF
jgi:hypothetical protein